MKNRYLLMVLAMAPATVTFGGTNPDAKKKALDAADMNKDVKPGVNFVEFAGGTWLKKTNIPDDKTSYGVFDILREKSIKDVQEILKEASATTGAPKGSAAQKIGDFYASGMDSTRIEKLGAAPLLKYINQINQIQTMGDVQQAITQMHLYGIPALFGAGIEQDFMNSRIYKMYLAESGLGMPDRDYYVKDTPHNKELQAAYKKLITKMLTLVGYTQSAAEEATKNIYALESKLAEASNTRLENRDNQALYNPVNTSDLATKYPSFPWNSYFTTLGLNLTNDQVIVMQPKFFKAADSLLKVTPVNVWKQYLVWTATRSTASSLSSDFVNANFEFYGKTLSGQKVISPRWKRVSNEVDGNLGEAIGQLYVQKHFPPAAKQRMIALIENLRTAYRARIQKLEWMSDATKAKAAEKLNKVMVKVGYPDKWKDYSSMEVNRDSYFENVLQASKFQIRENLNKYGKPVDITEWGMYPQTVNAYYNPLNNEIVFPAAILQPPFFNMDADDAVNYGAIGMVIGHEMTHGFDDQGKQFDANGNMVNWWTEDDTKKFAERTKVIIDQYNNFKILDSLHVDGELTQGENIADNGGLNISWDAYMLSLNGKKPAAIDGFTYDQRFFLGYAKVWRQKMRDKELMRRLKEDVHAPAISRVNKAIFNIDPLYKAFDIKPSDPLYIAPADRAKVW
ncbi:M13 family metallopeptidase [Alistipes sp. ZOR0009]|uniref:M13 family metallopeptidase n=1 Tax=Alistipes sp. ZOR0009 TaxID=1339253 RepID=UPI0006491619|nr:M13 family metallopeptidase [Alistipes sp. ZOR0009]